MSACSPGFIVTDLTRALEGTPQFDGKTLEELGALPTDRARTPPVPHPPLPAAPEPPNGALLPRASCHPAPVSARVRQGTESVFHLLFGDVPAFGWYWGSDAKRSPVDRRAAREHSPAAAAAPPAPHAGWPVAPGLSGGWRRLRGPRTQVPVAGEPALRRGVSGGGNRARRWWCGGGRLPQATGAAREEEGRGLGAETLARPGAGGRGGEDGKGGAGVAATQPTSRQHGGRKGGTTEEGRRRASRPRQQQASRPRAPLARPPPSPGRRRCCGRGAQAADPACRIRQHDE